MVAENCFVLPSCTEAEVGLIEIVTVGGSGFVPGLPAEPVQELRASVARRTQAKSRNRARAGADLRAVRGWFGAFIAFLRVTDRLAVRRESSYWPEGRIWHSRRKVRWREAKVGRKPTNEEYLSVPEVRMRFAVGREGTTLLRRAGMSCPDGGKCGCRRALRAAETERVQKFRGDRLVGGGG